MTSNDENIKDEEKVTDKQGKISSPERLNKKVILMITAGISIIAVISTFVIMNLNRNNRYQTLLNKGNASIKDGRYIDAIQYFKDAKEYNKENDLIDNSIALSRELKKDADEKARLEVEARQEEIEKRRIERKKEEERLRREELKRQQEENKKQEKKKEEEKKKGFFEKFVDSIFGE